MSQVPHERLMEKSPPVSYEEHQASLPRRKNYVGSREDTVEAHVQMTRDEMFNSARLRIYSVVVPKPHRGAHRFVNVDLPQDATIAGTSDDIWQRAIRVAIYSRSFSPVSAGSELPDFGFVHAEAVKGREDERFQIVV